MIPQLTLDSLNRYINRRVQPGGFLTAVLSNDLFGAVSRADSQNKLALTEICEYIYNEVPGNAWGSYDAVRNYIRGEQK